VKPFAEVTNLFSEAGIQFVYFFYLFVFFGGLWFSGGKSSVE